jgi:hypothetical protein
MSNGNPVNLTRLATKSLQGGHAPIPGYGESAKKEADRYRPITEHTMVKRTIPVTDFQPAGEPADAAAEEPKAAADPAAEKDRHTKWREAQEAKRTKRQTEKLDAEAKRQGFVGVLLQKGDLQGAAKAARMSVADFVAMTNNAAMGIKPEPEAPKKLTEKEQFDADRDSLRKDMAAFREEQATERNTRAMTTFIEKEISPVLADKDAYEMIHVAGAEDIKSYAYHFMNRHYYDTSEKDEAGNVTKPGEILSAKDVLDTIEEQLYQEQLKTIERTRAIKKVAKHLGTPPESGGGDAAAVAQNLGEGGAAAEADPTQRAGSTSLNDARRRRIQEAMSDMAKEPAVAEEEPASDEAELSETEADAPVRGNPAAPKVVRATAGANIRAIRPTGRLTAAEKIARARAEEHAAALKQLAPRR